nr:hypothetical protein [Wolbachia endosymbiont of Wuchereria bancrofti]
MRNIELFSLKESRINDDIMIPLSVPKEIDIFFGEFCRINPKRAIQSKIPDFRKDIYLKDCKNDVKFYLNSNNTISLSVTSGRMSY